jgi:hypothetical protein
VCLAQNAQLPATIGHTVSYSQASFTACMAAIQGALCNAAPSVEPSCAGIFTGTLTQNVPCHGNVQCADGLYCGGINTTTHCGTCVPRLANGNACQDDGDCLDLSFCKYASSTATSGTCTALVDGYKPAGTACGGTTGVNCQGYLVCAGATATVAGTCQAITMLGGGTQCTLNDDTQQCPITHQCTVAATGSTAGTCTVRPAVGTQCNLLWGQQLCAVGNYCSAWETTGNSVGNCKAKLGLNGSCAAAETAYHAGLLACAADLYCSANAGNTCVAPAPAQATPSCP